MNVFNKARRVTAAAGVVGGRDELLTARTLASAGRYSLHCASCACGRETRLAGCGPAPAVDAGPVGIGSTGAAR